MTKSTDTSYSGGGFFLSALALLFIGLKLTGFIHWSWWWVTAPLWGIPALILAGGVVALVVFGLVKLYQLIFK